MFEVFFRFKDKDKEPADIIYGGTPPHNNLVASSKCFWNIKFTIFSIS